MKKGILINSSIKSAGITFYSRNGRNFSRSSCTIHTKAMTEAQFNQRERMAHAVSLWHAFEGYSASLMQGRGRSIDCFISLALKLPPLFLTKDEHEKHLALLLPGIPVSCGTLTDLVYRLASVGGQPALVTTLRRDGLGPKEELRLFTVEQQGEKPQLKVDCTAVELDAFVDCDEGLALTGARYGDPRYGWALVRMDSRGRCSTQCLVTLSTAYREYQSEEAKERAMGSYV